MGGLTLLEKKFSTKSKANNSVADGRLKPPASNSFLTGQARIIIISLFATLACVGIIKAATTIGNNISTGGTITGGGANTLYGATSIGGAITATSTLNVTGLTTLGNASTTLLSVSSNSYLTTTSISGNLTVIGNSTLTGDLDVTGNTTWKMDNYIIKKDASGTVREIELFPNSSITNYGCDTPAETSCSAYTTGSIQWAFEQLPKGNSIGLTSVNAGVGCLVTTDSAHGYVAGDRVELSHIACTGNPQVICGTAGTDIGTLNDKIYLVSATGLVASAFQIKDLNGDTVDCTGLTGTLDSTNEGFVRKINDNPVGGKIYIHDGYYPFTDKFIDYLVPNVEIECESHNTILAMQSSFVIDQEMIYFHHANGAKVKNCQIVGYYGKDIMAIHYYYSAYANTENNLIKHWRNEADNGGVVDYSSSPNAFMTHNTFIDVGLGPYITSSWTGLSYGDIITNNIVDGAQFACMGANYIYDSIFTDNILKNCGIAGASGMDISGSYLSLGKNIISRNIIDVNSTAGAYGLYLNTETGITENELQYTSIKDNIITTGGGATTNYCISLGAGEDFNTISGNDCIPRAVSTDSVTNEISIAYTGKNTKIFGNNGIVDNLDKPVGLLFTTATDIPSLKLDGLDSQLKEMQVYKNSVTTASSLKLLLGWFNPAGDEADYSGNGNTMTANGTPAVKELVGQAWTFNPDGSPVADCFSRADDEDFSISSADTDDVAMTYSQWVYITSTGVSQFIAGKWDVTTGAQQREWNISYDPSDILTFDLYDESVDKTNRVALDATLTTGWHFISATFNGTASGDTTANGMTLYVDGITPAQTRTNSTGGTYVATEASATGAFYVGCRMGTAALDKFFQGNMGKPVFVKGETLSATTIKEVWRQTRGYLAL